MLKINRLSGVGKYIVFLVVALLITICLCAVKDRKAEESSKAAGYIVDESDMKIHKADCKLVQDISSDRRYVLTDIEALKEEGYMSCEVCNPR